MRFFKPIFFATYSKIKKLLNGHKRSCIHKELEAIHKELEAIHIKPAFRKVNKWIAHVNWANYYALRVS